MQWMRVTRDNYSEKGRKVAESMGMCEIGMVLMDVEIVSERVVMRAIEDGRETNKVGGLNGTGKGREVEMR